MDPPPSSGWRSSGRGGKGRPFGRGGKERGGGRLGLKTASSPAPSAPLAAPDSPPPPISLPAPPLVPRQATLSSPPAPAVLSSTSATPTPTMPSQPSQGAIWGTIPPNFPSQHGNQQAPIPWIYPPGGGFLNLIQTMTFNQISPPPPPSVYGTETPQAKKQRTSTNKTVNIEIDEDDKNDVNKTTKKRYWTLEEEERLASAWLNASKDRVKGNNKRGDTFWKEVTNEFNKKGNGKRTREINQLKIHWSRLKSSITDFNDYWTKVTQTHTSGYSDAMLEEEAQKMYANRFGKRFLWVHLWKKLKDEPRWCAQFQETSEVVDVLDEQSRPIGREAAKAERNGNGKKEDIMEEIVIHGDNIEKIVKLERKKVTEAQIQIANTNLKAAKEQKEAKMFEVYNSLLNQDTSQMSEDQKANRDRAIRKIEDKLFAD